MGALLLGAGLVGSAIASHFVDRTKLFEETVKTCFCLASVAAIFFSIVSVCVFMLLKCSCTYSHVLCCLQVTRYEDSKALVTVAVCTLGFFGFAVYPLSLELSVESTFPVAEATSSGVLMLSG